MEKVTRPPIGKLMCIFMFSMFVILRFSEVFMDYGTNISRLNNIEMDRQGQGWMSMSSHHIIVLNQHFYALIIRNFMPAVHSNTLQ